MKTNKLMEVAVKSAANFKNQKEVTKEELEVCLAYLNKDITARQYGAAIGYTTQSNAATRVAVVIRTALKNKWISIEIL